MKKKRKLRNQQQKHSLETKGKDYGKGNIQREATDEASIRGITRRFDNAQKQARSELRDFIAAEEGNVGGEQGGDGGVQTSRGGRGDGSSFRRDAGEVDAYHWAREVSRRLIPCSMVRASPG